MTDDVSQEGNVAGENISGRDTNITNYHYSSGPKRLDALVHQFRVEVAADQQLREFIEDLAVYDVPVDPDTRPDLAQKLASGGRGDQVAEAARLKELFWKRLTRNQFSRAAQEIYAYLLGLIHHRFEAYVRPLITAGQSRAEVDAAVARHVIEPVLQEIEDNPLYINVQQLRGMLFYLTGHCYVRWDA